jgi:hypothetical protein
MNDKPTTPFEGSNPSAPTIQISPLNPCCPNASNKTTATQFDRFNDRDLSLNIGIRSQRSWFHSSNCLGNPAMTDKERWGAGDLTGADSNSMRQSERGGQEIRMKPQDLG